MRCSGTIKKAEEEAVRRAKEFIVRARLQGGGLEVVEKAVVAGTGADRDVGDVVSESESD